jgi:hypothetical protein
MPGWPISMKEVESAMKTLARIFAAALCVMSLGLAQASAATSAATGGTKNLPSGLSFTYDAQHDQILANGLQLKAHSLASPTIPPTTGTVTVTLNIKIVSRFRDRAAIHCSLTLIGGELDLTNGLFDGGIETANGVAAPDGSGEATCTLKIPYSWSLVPDPTATNGLILAIGASAVHKDDGSDSQILRSTLQVGGPENLPSNGGTATYVFDVAL